MKILIDQLLKVILVSILLLGYSTVTIAQNEKVLVYELINEIAAEFPEGSLQPVFLDYFRQFDQMNPANYPDAYQIKGSSKLDLDSIFSKEQKMAVENQISIIAINKAVKVDDCLLKDSNKLLHSDTNSQEMKTVMSISFPIIAKGVNGCFYGIIIEARTWLGEGESYTRYYRKCERKWELIYEELNGMS